MQILFLSAWYPYPANNGSKIRIYNLLRGLAEHHDVTLISFYDSKQEPSTEELKKFCRDVQTIRTREYQARSLRALMGFFSTRPRVLVDRYEPRMAESIRREISSHRYDLVIASQWYMADYWEEFQDVPAIFEEAEIGVFMGKVKDADSAVKRFRHQMTNVKMSAYFRRLLERFEFCTVASEEERQLLRAMVPDYEAVEVLPNTVKLDDYRDVRETVEADTLIFTGSFRYHANYEAMRWFLDDVYPRVIEAVPSVQLKITGDHAGLTLPRMDRVILTGTVRDVRPLIAQSSVSLAPLQTGGGTRLKILEAMALRTPVIATSKGAEGLEAVPGEHLLVEDDPEEFAQAVIRLLEDGRLRRKLVNNAYDLIRKKYDWKVVLPHYLELVSRAVHSDHYLEPALQGEEVIDGSIS